MNSEKETKRMLLAVFVIVLLFLILMSWMYMAEIIDKEKFVGFSIMGLVVVGIFGGLIIYTIYKSKNSEIESVGKASESYGFGKRLATILFLYVTFSNYYFDDPTGPSLIGAYVAIMLYIVYAWRSSKKSKV